MRPFDRAEAREQKRRAVEGSRRLIATTRQTVAEFRDAARYSLELITESRGLVGRSPGRPTKPVNRSPTTARLGQTAPTADPI